MSIVETLPAPDECFNVAALLALTDADLRQRVPYLARLVYRSDRDPDTVREHARGVRERIEARWEAVRARLLFDAPADTRRVCPPLLHLALECAIRRGPRTAAQLRTAIAWANGPWTVEAVRDLGTRDMSEWRRASPAWPQEAAICRSGTLLPLSA